VEAIHQIFANFAKMKSITKVANASIKQFLYYKIVLSFAQDINIFFDPIMNFVKSELHASIADSVLLFDFFDYWLQEIDNWQPLSNQSYETVTKKYFETVRTISSDTEKTNFINDIIDRFSNFFNIIVKYNVLSKQLVDEIKYYIYKK